MDYFPAALENLVSSSPSSPAYGAEDPAAAIEALRSPS